MGYALPRRETLHQIIEVDERARAEHRRAALGYLVWPLALYEALVDREPASKWYQFHVRQALWFGVFVSIVGLLALAWPLVATLLIGNLVATIVIYVVALLIDAAVFVWWLMRAVRYSREASRGRSFEDPVVARWTRRLSAKR